MTIPGFSNASHQDAPTANNDHFYSVVPRSVAADARLTDRAFRLYAHLDDRARGRAINIRTETLAADLGKSESWVRRSMAELVASGYVTRKKTRAVWVTFVHNPIRKRSQQRTAAADLTSPEPAQQPDLTSPQRSDLTSPSRNNSLRNKNITNRRRNAGRDPQTVGATTAADPFLQTYVEVIAEATGIPLKPTRAVLAKIKKIAARGMTPTQAGEAARGEMALASGLRNVASPAGWLASVVLDDLADPSRTPVEESAQMLRDMFARTEESPAPSPRLSEAAGDPLADIKARQAAADPETAAAGVAACRAALRGEGTYVG